MFCQLTPFGRFNCKNKDSKLHGQRGIGAEAIPLDAINIKYSDQHCVREAQTPSAADLRGERVSRGDWIVIHSENEQFVM